MTGSVASSDANDFDQPPMTPGMQSDDICLMGTLRAGEGSLSEISIPPPDQDDDKEEAEDEDDELMELEEVGDGVYKCLKTGKFFSLK